MKASEQAQAFTNVVKETEKSFRITSMKLYRDSSNKECYIYFEPSDKSA